MEVSAGDVCRSVELIIARADPEACLEESCGAEKLLTDQVSVDRMDITKGFLEDISRPASSEIRRPSRDGGRSLEVLSADATHSEQVHRSSAHERTDLTAENSSDQEESDEENEDPELREAIKKMKRLDRVLALRASAEREVKQRGKQQHQRLWQELQTASLSMSSNEMENTRRFLALTPNNHQDGDEVDFVPVFETEVLDLKSDVNARHETDGKGSKRSAIISESLCHCFSVYRT
uniref:Fibrous sheath-interacting protein 1 n=1 Tax=Sinocyclocheilus grahami TaxID=75366 RepID=A0A672KQE5_SINGR